MIVHRVAQMRVLCSRTCMPCIVFTVSCCFLWRLDGLSVCLPVFSLCCVLELPCNAHARIQVSADPAARPHEWCGMHLQVDCGTGLLGGRAYACRYMFDGPQLSLLTHVCLQVSADPTSRPREWCGRHWNRLVDQHPEPQPPGHRRQPATNAPGTGAGGNDAVVPRLRRRNP